MRSQLQQGPRPPVYLLPPVIDAKFNSTALPWNTDHSGIDWEGKLPVVYQMCDFNINHQTTERNAFFDAKGAGYKRFRWVHRVTPDYCNICREAAGPDEQLHLTTRHHHSSFFDRISAETDYFGQYWCHNCHKLHQVKTGVRYTLVMGSSTINTWHGNMHVKGYNGNLFHCDFDTIP